MKKKLAILGSSHLLRSKAISELSEFYTLTTVRQDMSLISLMSNSLKFDRQKLLSGEDKTLAAHLLSEYEKDVLNDLVTSNPDVLLLDFFPDVQFGVAETLFGSYLTNNRDYYLRNPSFELIKTFVNYSPLDDFNVYLNIWSEALKDFILFITTYLPKTEVVVYENLKMVVKYLLDRDINTTDNATTITWRAFNKYTSETYGLSLVSDLFDLDLGSGKSVDNNVYTVNLIRNPKFENELEYWTNTGAIPFDDANTSVKNGELTLYGNRDEMATFNLLSAPINIAASPENPVDVVLSYEVFAEDVFDIEIYHDHVFIARGFENNLDVSNNEATQRIYDQQAKFLNLTSGKWKKIKKIISVTVPYLRVGPYVRGKTTVKWRNLSLKHHQSDEK